MPWRLALALQADGWWLRSDIIWEKPNPMPESTRDRPTKSHEYIFLLAKSERYYYDAQAIRDDWSPGSAPPAPVKVPGGWDRNAGAHGTIHRRGRTTATYENGAVQTGRNKRTVWRMATQPFPEAHFATFPCELPETCIKAATSERGVCPTCAAPWRRIVATSYEPSPIHGEGSSTGKRFDMRRNGPSNEQGGEGLPRLNRVDETLGWEQGCACTPLEPVAATVLDPFGGAGTTALVADRLVRHAILIELSESYAAMAERRIFGDAPLFVDCGTD